MSNKQLQIFGSTTDDAVWHGFKVDTVNQLANEFTKNLELLQRHASTIKTIIAEGQKNGVVSSFVQTDAVAKLTSSSTKLLEQLPVITKELGQLQGALGKWRSSELSSRKARFEAIANRQNWNLAGNWPEPVVEGTVFVVVDEKKDSATVNDSSVSGLPTAEVLAAEVHRQLDELKKSATEPEKFISEVWKAYQNIGGKLEDGVLVFDLLKELVWSKQSKRFSKNPAASLFKDYPTAQFRADMTNYLAAGSPAFRVGSETFSLEIVGGSYAENGLFMYFPQTKRLATCGRLTFRST